jgi:putative transposase
MPQWPHGPTHWLFEPGIYIVTAATVNKEQRFHTPERRDFLQEKLFEVAAQFGWKLEAWAILTNHYPFIARSPADPATLKKLLGKLHMKSAQHVNSLDNRTGEKVWFQYWDSHLTFERSYLARLNYVHHNPAKHGVVRDSAQYPWCSAAWFAEHAPAAFRATVESFKTDSVSVPDDF